MLAQEQICFHSHTQTVAWRLQTLPEWAKTTLQAHASDPRPHLMTDEQLDQAQTGDEVWDAAQHQLALTGAASFSAPATSPKQ